MRNKGFTLIELLAVIVILAIIALIATPVILNIINDSRVESKKRSAENYLDAVEQAVVRRNMYGDFRPTECEIDGKTLTCKGYEDSLLTINVTGKVPTSGTIYFVDNSVAGNTQLEYSDYVITMGADKKLVIDSLSDAVPTCEVIKGDGSNIGDEISCAEEEFYIIEIDNEENKISMLAKYNLNVGEKAYSSDKIGIQSENVIGGYDGYGTIAFSTTNYWWDSETNMIKSQYESNNFVYDNNSLLYNYIDSYATYLKQAGVKDVQASLISIQQLNRLGCDSNKRTCGKSVGFGAVEPAAPEWLYSTYYWTGTSNNIVQFWYIHKGGYLSGDDWDESNRYNNDFLGIRPVITIPKSNL